MDLVVWSMFALGLVLGFGVGWLIRGKQVEARYAEAFKAGMDTAQKIFMTIVADVTSNTGKEKTE